MLRLFSSSSPKTLESARLQLKNAQNAKDPDIALALCEQVTHDLKKTRTWAVSDQSLREKFGTAYSELGKTYDGLGHHDKAEASYRRSKKWGHALDVDQQSDSSRPGSTVSSCNIEVASHEIRQRTPTGNSELLPRQIFSQDARCPVVKPELPGPDEHITSTRQLAYCLSLLPNPTKSVEAIDKTALSETERIWLHANLKDTSGQESLRRLATDIVVEFIHDDLKRETTVAEIGCLAPVLDQEQFRKLLMTFVNGIEQSCLLEVNLLDGLAQVMNSASPGYLQADDLVHILLLLSTRLQSTHIQSTGYHYRLTLTVSHVLDAMVDSEVKGLKRVEQHEPLSAYLDGLKSHADPYLAYQAAYAYQALQYVPDDESPWQGALRRTGMIVAGISGMASAVKGLDLNGFIEGLRHIQKGIPTSQIVQFGQGVKSMVQSGQSFLDCIHQCFDHKSAWYPALRKIDALLKDGQLTDFQRLVSEAPCRDNLAFHWGLCQRLADLANNALWDAKTRNEAVDFLGEMYKNEVVWACNATTKHEILKILIQIGASSESALNSHVDTLLQGLVGNDLPSVRSQCREEGPGSHLWRVAVPVEMSSILLERALNRPEVEDDLHSLQKRRLKDQGEAVYIPPQAKANLLSTDDALFDLKGKIKDFLSSDRKVFLVLGDSGAGKSTFNQELEKDLWRIYEKKQGRIPLYINLPAVDKPEQDLIAKQLRQADFNDAQIKELKRHREFILICDGYDESEQPHNLYMSNRLNQPGEWRAHMVISCRSEYVGSDYQDHFQPTDRNRRGPSELFQEAVIAPFSSTQIQDYIKRYVSMERNQPPWQETGYQQALERIPNLLDLVKNPFLLTLALEVLPNVVGPGQDLSSIRITRVALYDKFVTQWIERGKKRLTERKLSAAERHAFGILTNDGFTRHGMNSLKNLAAAIYENQAGNPVVEYVSLLHANTWKDAFFGQDYKKQLLLEASPIKRNGNQYRFIHKSLLEYSVALAVFEPQVDSNAVAPEPAPMQARRGSMSSTNSFDSRNLSEDEAVDIAQPVLESVLARKSFVREPSVLQFLSERVEQEPLFKEQLLEVIQRSKTDKKARKAAANAITILIRAGVQFNGEDLQGIQIPGANLSHGVFDSAQLQGADLRDVNLRNIWFRQADLSGAKMEGVKFGELPILPKDREVKCYAYSPDGGTCAVGLWDGQISLYATSSWEQTMTLSGHNDPVAAVVYSPNGKTIASGSEDCTVRLWDAKAGTCLHTLSGHSREVASVVYSPDSDQIASGSDDKTVRLWDVKTGTSRHTLSGHSNWVRSVVFSPAGNQIASGSDDMTVRLWDVKTGTCRHTLGGHSHRIRSVTYSPEGNQITSSCRDNTMRLWDVHTGACRHMSCGRSAGIRGAVQKDHPNVSASGDGMAGDSRPSAGGHGDWVRSAVYSPKGDQIASGSDDETVRLWDAETGACRHTLSDHTEWVRSVAYSPNGSKIASGSDDTTVRLWDAETGACLHTLSGHNGGVWSVAYSPKGDHISSGGDDAAVRLWDVETGTCRHTLTGHGGGVRSVVYSPNGSQIASGGDDKTVRLWDVETGACRHTLSDHSDWVRSVAFSPAGNQIASGSDDMTVRLWDVETGACHQILSSHSEGVYCVAYSPNGAQIASGSADKTARLWDVETGQVQIIIGDFGGAVTSVAWEPSEHHPYLITGSGDKSVRKWQIANFEGEYKAHLRWSSGHEVLTVTNSSIEGVRGLSLINKRLLNQRGSVGKPSDIPDKPSNAPDK